MRNRAKINLWQKLLPGRWVVLLALALSLAGPAGLATAAEERPWRLAVVELPAEAAPNDGSPGRRFGGGAVGSLGGLGGVERSRRGAMLDLLTVRLSALPGMVLVERAALDALLRETGLSMASLAQPAGVTRAGQLLRADGFLLVTYPPGLTNAALGRVVDGATGIVRDLQVAAFEPGGVEAAAAALAGLVERTRVDRGPAPTAPGAAAEAGRRWIGFGAFEDLGLYPRYPDLGERLRTALAVRQAGNGRLSLVERRYVATLVEEMRLGRLGLLGPANAGASAGAGPAGETSQAQPAFLLVDGMYQAYQDERSLVQLVLRLEWVGGRREAVRIKAAPGAELEGKVVEAVERFLAEPPVDLGAKPPTRATEARVQLERAYDLMKLRRSARATYYRPPSGLSVWGVYPKDRVNSVREAIAAFESVLLLEPGHLEARFGRAGCWADPVIDRLEEARDEWREIVVSTTNALAALTARRALAESYLDRDDRVAVELLVGLRSALTNLSELVSLNSQVQGALAGLTRRNEATPGELREAYTAIWTTEIRWAADELAKGRKMDVFRVFTQPMGYFSSAFKGSNAVVERRAYVETLVSGFLREFPQFEWYLVPAFVRSGDASPSWLARHEKLLATCESAPARVVSPANFYPDVLRSDLRHWMRQGNLALAERAARVFELGGMNHLGIRSDRDEMEFFIGHVRFLQGRYDAAVAAFERIGSRQVSLDDALSAAWGGGRFISGHAAAELCRQKAIVAAGGKLPERPSGPQPVRVFGSNELYLALAPDSGALWLHDRQRLHVVDPATGKAEPVAVPIHPRVRQMVVYRGLLWVATGGGLQVWDPATGAVVTNSVEQGLLMPSVTALAPDGDRVWVGFGTSSTMSSSGGLGYWDLAAKRFVGRMVELPESVALEPGYKRMRGADAELKGMPRQYVIDLWSGPGGGVWILAPNRLFRHLPAGRPEWSIAEPQFSGARVTGLEAGGDWVAVATREPSGWSSDHTNFGGLFLIQPAAGTHRRIGRAEGLPNNDVTAVRSAGDRLLLGGLGFLARLDPATGRLEKVRRLAGQHPIANLTPSGRDLWYTSGPGLYRVPLDLEWDEASGRGLPGGAPAAPGPDRPLTNLDEVRALQRAQAELKRVYGTTNLAEYERLTERHLAFVRSVARDFPLLTFPTRTDTNGWFVERTMNVAGRRFDGIRFRNTLNEPADLGWIFANEFTGSFASWWIYPMEGPALKGFDSRYGPTMAYTNAPWSRAGSPGAKPGTGPAARGAEFNPTLQFLSDGQLVPGREYVLWFEFRDQRPTHFYLAAELFPARLKHRSRTVLEGTFGLSGPPVRGW